MITSSHKEWEIFETFEIMLEEMMAKSNCPICGINTQGDIENESLVVNHNIVCKDPVCREEVRKWLSREQLPLNLPYNGDP